MAITVTCPKCGSHVEPQVQRKGSMKLQIVLWFCFIVPGLFYSMWRETTRKLTCPQCHFSGLKIPGAGIGRLKYRKSLSQH